MQVSGVHIDGGMVEYLSVPSYALVHGEGLSVDALALVDPLSVGAHGVRRAAVAPGEFVLVVGAGPIGLGTMAFARIAGAKVIALDLNPQRLAFCKERLKVDHAIHAASPDVLQQLQDITGGDMPTVVFDVTGNLKAINHAFNYMAHGGRYVLIGLQKGDISFSHPEFHKREGTLLSSRNATRQDFVRVLAAIGKGEVDPATYITHRVAFDKAADAFASWLNPASGVIKAMIEVP
jgi:2-desacetyl-2-hydroxyethyl bacteriochlorophyllide A dehydrogenase